MRRAKRWSIAVAVGILLPLGACGSDDEAEAPEGVTTNPVDYAMQYMAIATRANCASTELNQEYELLHSASESEIINTLPVLALANHDLLNDEYEAFDAVEWPPEVQPSVDTMIIDLQDRAAFYLRLSESRDADSIVDATTSDLPASSDFVSATREARQALGIDEAGYEDTDWCAEAATLEN